MGGRHVGSSRAGHGDHRGGECDLQPRESQEGRSTYCWTQLQLPLPLQLALTFLSFLPSDRCAMAGLVLDLVESVDPLEFEPQLYFQQFQLSAEVDAIR